MEKTTANTSTNSFNFRGLTFTPYKELKGKSTDFHAISRKISDISITPKGWNWHKFYDAANKANPDNSKIDLFICHGHTVIPGENYLFAYKE